MILYGIQSRLLLRNGPGVRKPAARLTGAGESLQPCNFQAARRFGGFHIPKIRVLEAIGPQGVLHKAGACLGPVFIVAMLAEGVHHGLHIVENLPRPDRLGDQHAHAVARGSQSPGDAEGEGPVGLGLEAHVPEGAVDRVVHPVGKGDLQLSRHVNVPADGKEIFGHRLRPRTHIERLALLNAGEGTAHNVPGIVSAPAPADNAVGDGFLHDGGHLIRRKVVELHRFAGGELHPPDMVFLHRIGQEFQLLLGQPPAGQPQTEHVLRRVPLGIAAHAAGITLIVLFLDFALLEIPDFPGEAFNLLSIGLEPFGIHHAASTFFPNRPPWGGGFFQVIIPRKPPVSQSPIGLFPQN